MNKYLLKLAKTLETKPSKDSKQEKEKPHVIQALNKLEKNDGLIVHWGTGSGKTRAFLLAAAKAQQKDKTGRALIVAPASLVTNVDKEIEKHDIPIDPKRLEVYSYEKATRIADELSKNKYAIAIADEAQKLRNADTQRTKSLSEIFTKADKRVLSTATANYNHAADIAPLINIAAGGEKLPEEKKKFENRYIAAVDKPRSLSQIILRQKPEQEDKLARKEELAKLFKKHVHYYDPKEDPAAKDKFPKVTEKNIEVEMDPDQLRIYKFLEGRIPFWLRMKIRHNLPLDKQEKAQLNSFSSGVRQVSNTHRGFVNNPDDVDYSPKFKKALESLQKGMEKDKNFKALVYSNYLDSGVHEYSRMLSDNEIKHGIFTGSLTKEEKDKLVKGYNSGKFNVLLVSSSGAEGLDLKGTKKTQILEPHFNKSKIKQVAGRGARYESHEHLPKEERTMEVEHYYSVHPKGILNDGPTSIDKYLGGMSDDKQALFEQIKQVMKENS